MDLTVLAALVAEVKPSAAGVGLTPQMSLVDDLGLDSLDILQLLRKVQRATGKELVIEDWADQEMEKEPPQFTIASLLALLES